MEEIRKYIDNSLFIKWVFDPDENINEYWNFYLEKHPEEKEVLQVLKNELSLFQISGIPFSEERKQILSRKIAHRIQKRQQMRDVKNIGRFLFKYAAIAVLCIGIGIGGSVLYFYQNDQNLADFTPYFEMPEMSNKPMLVLSDGSNVNLNKKESSASYVSNDHIIVNEDSIVSLGSNNKKQDALPNQMLIPYGCRGKVVLGDRSEVWLNAGSRLIYPSQFTGKEREVFLFGEAFFQIEKDESKPFIVRTTEYKIKVLGTQFNVSSYPGDGISQTVLTEGSIELDMNNNGWLAKGIVLSPNEMFSFDKNLKEGSVRHVQTEQYVLWKDGIVKFNNEDLSRVIKKIERFYNIQIKLKDPLDGTIKIDGKLNLKEDRYEVLHYVSKVAKRKYVEINDRYFIIE